MVTSVASVASVASWPEHIHMNLEPDGLVLVASVASLVAVPVASTASRRTLSDGRSA